MDLQLADRQQLKPSEKTGRTNTPKLPQPQVDYRLRLDWFSVQTLRLCSRSCIYLINMLVFILPFDTRNYYSCPLSTSNWFSRIVPKLYLQKGENIILFLEYFEKPDTFVNCILQPRSKKVYFNLSSVEINRSSYKFLQISASYNKRTNNFSASKREEPERKYNKFTTNPGVKGFISITNDSDRHPVS